MKTKLLSLFIGLILLIPVKNLGQTSTTDFANKAEWTKIHKQQQQKTPATTTTETLLDSIVEKNADGQTFYKKTYAYNANNLVVEECSYGSQCINGNCTLVKNNKIIREYDANGNETLYAYYYWNSSQNTWDGLNKATNTYNAQNKITEKILYSWNSTTNDWQYSEKTTFTYNADNSIFTLQKKWDAATSTWKDNYRKTETYAANGNWLGDEDAIYDTNADAWIPLEKSIHSYNPDNNYHILTEYQKWNATENAFIPVSRFENLFDANGRFAGHNRYEWDNTAHNWKKIYRDEVTYNAENPNKTVRIEYNWNNTTSNWDFFRKSNQIAYNGRGWDFTLEEYYDWIDGAWVGMYKRESPHDANGKVTSITNYDWDNATSNWIEKSKEEYTYNADGTKSIVRKYNYNQANWLLSSTETYHYSPKFSTKIENAAFFSISIFPNPATDYFAIHGLEKETTISVFDISGKIIVRAKNVLPNEKISVTGWNKGVYFVKINNKTAKLVVK